MKRLLVLISTVALSAMLVACGGDSQGNKENNSGTKVENGSNTEVSGNFEYTANGTEIMMHQKAKTIIDALGDATDYFESESCAFEGLDKIYTYSGFEVSTYEKDGVDYIAGVSLMDDTVSTAEGVSLFESKEDMIAAYGEDFKEVEGIYTYKKGESQISFMIKEGQITQIEYTALH